MDDLDDDVPGTPGIDDDDAPGTDDDDDDAPGIGADALAREMADAVADSGLTMDALTVLNKRRDPFRMDTPAWHRDGRWFVEQTRGFTGRHLRGVHYYLVGHDGAAMPNGKPYLNDDDSYKWLMERAAKAARWLGYVDFDSFDDHRAAEPVVFRPEPTEIEIAVRHGLRTAAIDPDDGKWTLTNDVAAALPVPTLAGFKPRQKYALALFGEKSSLEDELRPLCARLGIDMYLATGEQSDTHIHRIAKDAVEVGLPLVVVTVSDFDPSGWQMPISIARKLRAFQVALFGDLEYRVIAAGLTHDQCVEHDLPSTPLKATERRASKWQARWGREQTEVDAMLALHPGEIADAVRAAFDPYFDDGLADRIAEAREEWMTAALATIRRKIGRGPLDDARSRYAAAMAEIEQVNNDLGRATATVKLDEPDEVDAEPPFDFGDEGIEPIASSDLSFVEESVQLLARKRWRTTTTTPDERRKAGPGADRSRKRRAVAGKP